MDHTVQGVTTGLSNPEGSPCIHLIIGESCGVFELPRSELEDVDVSVPGRLPEGPFRVRLHDGDVLPRAGLGVAHLQPPDQTLFVLEKIHI